METATITEANSMTMTVDETLLWLEKFDERVLRERGDMYTAALPTWKKIKVDRSFLFQQLDFLLARESDWNQGDEDSALKVIRAVSTHGGKRDLMALIDLTAQSTNIEVLCGVMDCALAIGGSHAVHYLYNAIERYRSEADGVLCVGDAGILYSVATYDFHRLCSEGYDMMAGPVSAAVPAAALQTDTSTLSVAGFCDVANDRDTYIALDVCNRGSAKEIRDMLTNGQNK